MVDLDAVMRTTATVRYYTQQPVDDAVLYRVFDRARFAPNGGNRQGWRVIVVTDPDLRRRLRDLYLESWIPYATAARARAGEGPVPRTSTVLDRADEYAHALHEVPVHLVILARMDALAVTDAELGYRDPIVGGASVYPFVQNILLGCRAEGLGSTLTTVMTTVEPKVAELLGIPDGYGVAALVTVGHPDRERLPGRLSRAPVEDFVTRERFGGPAFGGAEDG
ncbi:nitroreductase family protein [Nitriliruptoraceae bacterium ZYF776]|nr:nitroreductase family protein [Profundirhabdus halotolerans]